MFEQPFRTDVAPWLLCKLRQKKLFWVILQKAIDETNLREKSERKIRKNIIIVYNNSVFFSLPHHNERHAD